MNLDRARVGDGSVMNLEGCACCDDFELALKDAVRRTLREGVDLGSVDYLLLETSGVADPSRLITVLEAEFGPACRARLDKVVVVCDAERIADLARALRDLGATRGEGTTRAARPTRGEARRQQQVHRPGSFSAGLLPMETQTLHL